MNGYSSNMKIEEFIKKNELSTSSWELLDKEGTS
jgi:hypothetical protein